jgi:hypothetical protein
MHGQEGLAAGRRTAVDSHMDEHFLDLSHRCAAGESASHVDGQFFVSTQRAENAEAQECL